jgi:ketosteroid isomerase-like protein
MAKEIPMLQPKEVLASILKEPMNIDKVRSLVADDVTYVSLNYDNPDLHRIMPWAGTGRGAERIVKTFVDVDRFWEKVDFRTEALFGDDACAAMFGRFTYKSRRLGKTVTSPFSVFARVSNGKCTYLQFMEDTFATGASFRSGGSWTFVSDPDGQEVVI